MSNTKESAAIGAAETLMRDTMARYDPSHDAYHVERVRRTALSISHSISSGTSSSRKLNPDPLVVELAALLHDVLDKKYVTPAEAADPYAFFLPFFQSLVVDHNVDLISDGRARLITRIVENVSWTTEKKLLAAGLIEDWHRDCVELHCVQDADRLDAIGAFGVLRCAAYSAVTNRALYISRSDPKYQDSAIEHFHDKLVHIKDRLKTEPGRKMGEKRHQLMLDFLQSVEEEYNAAIPL